MNNKMEGGNSAASGECSCGDVTATAQHAFIEKDEDRYTSSESDDSLHSSLFSSCLSNHWLPDADENDFDEPESADFIDDGTNQESFEDDKAEMLAALMKNHARFVSSSLVGRSSLIQSVVWLSRHIPGCVLKSLLHTIKRARKEKERAERRRKRNRRKQTNKNII